MDPICDPTLGSRQWNTLLSPDILESNQLNLVKARQLSHLWLVAWQKFSFNLVTACVVSKVS